VAFDRLDRALRDRPADLVTLRQQIQILSSTLRSLLPNKRRMIIFVGEEGLPN
jgi:hypothetical protein